VGEDFVLATVRRRLAVAVPFVSDAGMRADRSTEEEVMAVLDAFNEALERRDLDATLALFVQHPDVTLVGSEQGETATGPSELRSFFERIFARPGIFRFEWRSCTVSARGDVAWFFADAIARYTENDHIASVAYRTTGVLEREQNHWLLAQYHGSEPVR
jgi:ketosteroid isomerase-like protein